MSSNKKEEVPKKITATEKREFYGLILLTFPLVLMAIVSQYISNAIVRIISQVLLFFFQAVVTRGILESR